MGRLLSREKLAVQTHQANYEAILPHT